MYQEILNLYNYFKTSLLKISQNKIDITVKAALVCRCLCVWKTVCKMFSIHEGIMAAKTFFLSSSICLSFIFNPTFYKFDVQ